MIKMLQVVCIILFMLPWQVLADTYDTHTLVRIYLAGDKDKTLINQSRLDVTNAGKDWVEALLTDEDFGFVEKHGLKYEILYDKMMKERASRAIPGLCTNTAWPCYYAPSTYNMSNPPSGTLMKYLLDHYTNHPTITRVYDIGTSQDGNYDILAIKVTDNPDVEENEPELRIYANIHGDETGSMMVSCAALDWILANYGSDPVATKLVDEAELWFIPNGNPWGMANQTRYNSRSVDLNRNFWGPAGSDESPAWSESETTAIRDLTEIGLPGVGETPKIFVVSLSFHGGEVCFNAVYNYTSTATPDEPTFFQSRTGGPSGEANPSPDGLAMAYYEGNTTPGFWYTNGADWYVTRGDTNDWSYYSWSSLDTTLEVTMTKWPDSSLIPTYTAQHTQAVINYLMKSFQGISGIMSDAGAPLDGSVIATCTADCPSYVGTGRVYKAVLTDSDVGDFHRVLLPGTYDLQCVSPGYTSYTISGIGVTADTTTWVNCTWNSPDLVYQANSIDDSVGGNDDGFLNPGEAVIISLAVKNTGELAGTTINGVLTTADPWTTISDANASFPNLNRNSVGQSLPDHFAFSVSSGVPAGHHIPFVLQWTAAGGYSGSTGFSVDVQSQPLISNVQISLVSAYSALITWDTDVPATSWVTYGASTPPSLQEGNTVLTTSHSVVLSGLDPCTTYYFSVTSANAVGYASTDDNAGEYYHFTTYMMNLIFSDGMESGSATWTAASPWAISTEASHSPTHAWSDSPGGTYANSLNTSLTSTPFDLSGVSAAEISFWHTYDLEPGYDYGYLEISTNGSSWTSLATYNGSQTVWTEVVHDLSSYIGYSSVQIRFRLTSDGGVVADGWHIDDVIIGSAVPCIPLAEYAGHLAIDACAGGGAGDNDGIFDAGETITFQIDVGNVGSGSLTGVWAELSSSTTGVTVTDSQADYPDILEGTTETSLSPHFTVSLSQSIVCGSTIDFDVAIHSAEGDFSGSFSRTVGVILSGNGTALDVNFSGGIPGTWTIVDGGSGGGAAATWTAANPGGRTAIAPMSSPFVIVDSDEAGSGATQNEQLISPVMDLSSATSATLAFDQYFYYYSSGGDEYGDVDVRSSLTGGAWQNVYRNHGASSANPDHRVIDITARAAGAADVQIRFYYYGGAYDWYWMVDNITVTFEAPGGCTMNVCAGSGSVEEVPDGTNGSDPVTVSVSGNDVVLSFDPAIGASHYNVYRGSLDSLHATGAYCHDARITEEACSGSPDTTVVDVNASIDGTNYYYLINGNNAVCEGTFGTDSTGFPREDTYWPAAAVCYSLCP